MYKCTECGKVVIMEMSYVQNVERYFTNESCYICTKSGDCLTMVNTSICNEYGKSVTIENGYKWTRCQKK